MSDSKANQRAKDQARAAYMAKYPSRYPDSVMKEGATRRAYASVHYTRNPGDSRWMRGMAGGIAVGRLTGDWSGVPQELRG